MTTADRIIEAALQLMSERGLGGVTMKAVAETAGVARQTLYNHFSDVDTIVGSAIEAHQTDSLAALRSLLSTIEAPGERLDHLVRHFASSAAHHAPLAAIQHGLSGRARESLAAFDLEILAIIEEALEDGVARGDFRNDIVATRDARLVHGMLGAAAGAVAAKPDELGDIVAGTIGTVRAAVAA